VFTNASISLGRVTLSCAFLCFLRIPSGRQQGRNADHTTKWIRAGSPTRTKPLASATPKEWPQRGYAIHDCPKVLVFDNLGIRGEFTREIAKRS
jgi:hypothetical protein